MSHRGFILQKSGKGKNSELEAKNKSKDHKALEGGRQTKNHPYSLAKEDDKKKS